MLEGEIKDSSTEETTDAVTVSLYELSDEIIRQVRDIDLTDEHVRAEDALEMNPAEIHTYVGAGPGVGPRMGGYAGLAELASIALGVPPWLEHFRTVNNISTVTALILSFITIFSQSFFSGLAYAGLSMIGWAVVSGLGTLVAQRMMVFAVVLSTILLLALNITLALKFLI